MDLLHVRGVPQPRGAEMVNNRIIFQYGTSRRTIKSGFSLPAFNNSIRLEIRFNDSRRKPQHLFLGVNRKSVSRLPLEIDVQDPDLKGDPGVDPQTDTGGFLWRDDKGHLVYEFVGRQGSPVEGSAGILTLFGEGADSLTQFGVPMRRSSLENTLYRNDKGTFTDVTGQAGIKGTGKAHDAIAADFNNDGFLDVYIVNGKDFITNHPNNLYLNNGDGTFTDIARGVGAEGPRTGDGNGAVAFDFDLDGDLDLFLYNGYGGWPGKPGPLVLLQNKLGGDNHFIDIDLLGTVSNSRAWGARVIAKMNGKTLYQQKYALNGHLSTSDLPVHIGLGDRKHLEELQIIWPSGQDIVLYNLPAGSRLTLKE